MEQSNIQKLQISTLRVINKTQIGYLVVNLTLEVFQLMSMLVDEGYCNTWINIPGNDPDHDNHLDAHTFVNSLIYLIVRLTFNCSGSLLILLIFWKSRP